jgi:hypothetical protein
MALQTDILCLCFAYVLLCLLLLVVLTRLPIPRMVKLGSILAAGAFYIAVFFSTQGLLGWSAPVAVPDRFQVLWTRVIEPNPSRQQPGAVHLWLEELDDANLPSGVPRAYLLPYSAELAARVADAQAEIEKGHPQGGRAQFFGNPAAASAPAGPSSRGVAPGGDPSGGGMLDPAFLGGQSKTVELAPLPKPALPEKDAP